MSTDRSKAWRIIDRAGHIDILHCNAGTYIGGDLVETNPAEIDRMLNLNVNAVIKNVHAVIPHMTERGTGDIVVTCSVAGNTAAPWEPVLLTRHRNVTIRDMVIVPTNFDI